MTFDHVTSTCRVNTIELLDIIFIIFFVYYFYGKHTWHTWAYMYLLRDGYTLFLPIRDT